MKHQFINLFILLGIFAVAVGAMWASDNLPKTKRFIESLRRLWRFKNFRRDTGRQIEANRRHLAEKRANVRGIVY